MGPVIGFCVNGNESSESIIGGIIDQLSNYYIMKKGSAMSDVLEYNVISL
jgi:hypothetical protein